MFFIIFSDFSNLFYPFFWSITEMKSIGSGNLIIESEKNKINIVWLKNGISKELKYLCNNFF